MTDLVEKVAQCDDVAKALRQTAAVFNALADTLDKQNGGAK